MHFGVLLPLPFVIKLGSGAALSLPGLPSTVDFVSGSWAMILAFFGCLLFARGSLTFRLLLLILFIFMLSLDVITEPMMNFSHRFQFPVLFLILAGGLAVNRIPEIRVLRCAALSAFAIIAYGTGVSASQTATADALSYEKALCNAHARLGRALKEIGSPSLAIADAVIVPYLSNSPTIDLYGLNDNYICINRLSWDQLANYTLQSKPQVLVIMTGDADATVFPLPSQQPLRDAALRGGYIRTKTMTVQDKSYYLDILTLNHDVSSRLREALDKQNNPNKACY